MRAVLAVLIGKLLRFAVRLLRPGGGSSLPGSVANQIHPNLLRDSLQKLPMGLIVVSGSAGKSSTTHYLVSLLEAHDIKVLTNKSTANIRRGLVGAVRFSFGAPHQRLLLEEDEDNKDSEIARGTTFRARKLEKCSVEVLGNRARSHAFADKIFIGIFDGDLGK